MRTSRSLSGRGRGYAAFRGIILFLTLIAGTVASAQPSSGGEEERARRCGSGDTVECGWWWNYDEINNPFDKKRPTPTPAPIAAQPVQEIPTAQVEIDCTDPQQWVTPCGFVDPAGDFDFQAQQRDALRRQMVMSVNDPAAVKEFQKYNRWAIDQAIQIASVWEFNLIQDPSINPLVTQPTSTFGLSMLDRERDDQQTELFSALKDEGAFFVFFTRSDCRYCHDMEDIMGRVEVVTGLEVHNASLDETCLPHYEKKGDRCLTSPATIPAAQYLGITVVPDVILHIPSTGGWIRVATGVNAVNTIVTRTRLFTNAVRAAVENGIQNAQDYTPSVDFRTKANALVKRGVGAGVPLPE